MAKNVQDAYSEILRLRNLFYQKWIESAETDEPSGYIRTVLSAKYEAFNKALELLSPSIVDPQPKDSGELTHSVTKISDQEEPVSEDLLKASMEFAKGFGEWHYAMPCFQAGAKWHKQQMIKSAKLSGWVARDENGSLHLFEVEPSRIMHRWWDRDYHSTTLDNKDFPDLEWENEPVYVKLPIIVED